MIETPRNLETHISRVQDETYQWLETLGMYLGRLGNPSSTWVYKHYRHTANDLKWPRLWLWRGFGLPSAVLDARLSTIWTSWSHFDEQRYGALSLPPHHTASVPSYDSWNGLWSLGLSAFLAPRI